MIMSMTGYGRGIGTSERRTITVELKSLNSKQIDLQARIPQSMRELEVDLRNKISESLERGKIEFAVSETLKDVHVGARINSAALKSYKEQIHNISKLLNISEPADWYTVLLRMPEVMETEPLAFDDDDKDAVNSALNEALVNINNFRLTEGRKLYKFFSEKIERIHHLLIEVEPYDAERVPKIKARLEEQLTRLDSIEYDKGRLEQEMIYYIEKLDVTEEKTRLRAHLQYFMDTMGNESDLPEKGQGKKLGFIAQEMGREINTLGSKSNQAEMQMIVVKMKDELEQIKEQVLNVL